MGVSARLHGSDYDVPKDLIKPMPTPLQQQLDEIGRWAKSNLDDAKRDTIRYWSFKIPAIISSAFAGIFAYFKLEFWALIVGAIGSICVLIDGLYPSGTLRNAHLKAAHDLRTLQKKMISTWQSKSLTIPKRSKKLETLAGKIISDAQAEIERIAAYIRDAETSLEEKRKY